MAQRLTRYEVYKYPSGMVSVRRQGTTGAPSEGWEWMMAMPASSPGFAVDYALSTTTSHQDLRVWSDQAAG